MKPDQLLATAKDQISIASAALNPDPCGEWSVRSLVNEALVAVRNAAAALESLQRLVEGCEPPQTGDKQV